MQKPTNSDPNCTSLGCFTDTNDPFTRVTDPGYPVDYPVPDLGMDKDIADTHKHMEDAETVHGKWELPPVVEAPPAFAQRPSVPACTSLGCATDTVDPYTKTTAPGYPVDYPVPNLGQDTDIAASMKHMNDAEGKLGAWNLPEAAAVQLNSDPIVGTANEYMPHLSADYGVPLHPMDYFVPDFGLDEDIVATQAHEAAASEDYGHKWEPYQVPHEDDPTGKVLPLVWERIPTEDAEFKLLQTGVSSDPHLQTYGTKVVGDDRYWLDKHFPLEGRDDVENLASYDFAPALDDDMVVTAKNLADQEDTHVHTLSEFYVQHT